MDLIQIADRLEITELVNAYALYIDQFQIDEWVDLFAQDAFFDEREFGSGLISADLRHSSSQLRRAFADTRRLWALSVDSSASPKGGLERTLLRAMRRGVPDDSR